MSLAAPRGRSTAAPPAPRSAWRRDAIAGGVAAVVTIAAWLTLGVLAYLPLGTAAAGIGIPAACTTVAIGGLVTALASRSVMPAGGLSSATTLLLAATIGELARDPQLQGDGTALLVAAASLCVVAMGLLQVLFGLLRLGSLARYVPQPVLAGFMNAIAVLVLLAQVPLLLGVDASRWSADPLAALAQAQPATAAVGLATAATVWLVAWRFARAPAALVGLLAGCALYAAIRSGWPGLALGPTVGAVPAKLPLPDALLPLAGASAAALARHLEGLVLTALLLAIVGSLETVLNARATDQQTNTRHDPNRELMAFGAGNVVGGICGALPLVYHRSAAAALIGAGAATRRAAALGALATGALFVAGGRLIAALPLAVLAGIMVTVAFGLADRWTRELIVRGARGERSRELWANVLLVVVVFTVTLWLGFGAGVLLGVLLAMGLFIHAMNRSLVRASYRATQQPSRRVYAAAQEAWLRQARREIAIVELEGALFFGNAERLAAELERIDSDCRFVVLDLKRISTLDASAAAVLPRLAARLERSDRVLLLAGVTPENRHGRVLRTFGAAADEACWFADSDQATEAAELRLLAEAGLALGDAEVPLDDCTLLQGLDRAQRERVRALLARRELAPGERLFRQGDAGDCLYVLTRGSITVSSAADERERLLQRYVSFSPGMMLGETAMLDGRGRTADAFADAPSTVFALPRDALERLRAEDPALAAQLLANIALHLSERLRHAAGAWRHSAA